MTTLRMVRLSIEGAEDPIDGLLPLLHGVPRPGFEPGAAPYPDMAANLEYGRPSTLLPYTGQDSYTRRCGLRDLPSLVLENELLSATFLPGYGGRLWSLVHRPSGRELLHRNPILQPANLALRDAWLAGGVEWNLGATGHWPLTCSPLHAVRLTAPDGTPVLRMYELERMRRVVVTIDAWLPAGSPVLLVHVSLHNPAPSPTPVYWWTNIAVPQGPDVRVVAPAEQAFHFDYAEQLRLIDFPQTAGGDQSYPATFPQAADFFMDVPGDERRWIAALDGDGRGLVQTSTDRLVGRKLFQWGTGAGGQRWQEWLSGPDAAYIEIQAGLARTQLEHLALPGGETWEWAEAFGLLEVDPERVHGSWASARAAVNEAVEMLVPRVELDDALGEAGRFAPPADLLARGSGWGALEVAAGTVPADPLRPFGDCGEDQQPWLDLLQRGRLPISDPPAAPVLGTHWRELLEASADDWHACYHLGLLRLADDDRRGAREVLERSVADHPNPWALRALAHLAEPADPPAADLLLEAHRLRPDLRELTIELLQALIASDRHTEALEVIAALADPDREHGRIRLCTAQAALAVGDLDRVRRLLDEGITVDNLREGEAALDTLWLAVHPGEPVPPAYDFRMTSG
ncbi:protein of unknown function [Nocardioides sp. YR527]|uniref:DUF5107 domain-containing protein n=1 Tax=Nocardioides sp. YR527 TaxID=1881028 RepID=UPI0008912BBC|nr:DUF5107 domain-containing protein [Nocardioides sp. YR527]SDK26934.1 protein of unknown function [Nocardioides sp. YR527]